VDCCGSTQWQSHIAILNSGVLLVDCSATASNAGVFTPRVQHVLLVIICGACNILASLPNSMEIIVAFHNVLSGLHRLLIIIIAIGSYLLFFDEEVGLPIINIALILVSLWR
jgi:hypothetical protein